MSAGKLVTAQEGAALIVNGLESRMITLTIEIEGACPTVMGEQKITRFRNADGRWISAKTVIARLEALGCDLKRFTIGEPGKHTPNY